MTKSYTDEAQRLADEYARHFHGPSFSLGDNDAAKANQAQVDHLVGQQRESVGILKDAEALRILEEAREQARNYASARNRGASPKAFDPNSKEEVDIRNGIKTWIESKRNKGWFKKTN